VAESNTPDISTSFLNKPLQTYNFISFLKVVEYTTVVSSSFIKHLLDLGKSVSAVAVKLSGCWMLSTELRSLLRLFTVRVAWEEM